MDQRLNIFPEYFDWNTAIDPTLPAIDAIPRPTREQLERLQFDDEGPRDGLQGTDVFPGTRDIEQYVAIAAKLGIQSITVGIYAGEKSRPEQITFAVLKYMALHTPTVTPIVIVRPLESDLAYAKKCKAIHPTTEVLIFQGSSPPRLWVQGWTEASVLEGLARAIRLVNEECGGGALSTLEDSTRATPTFIRSFLEMSVREKAKRVVFADTTGHLDPWGAYRFIRFAREVLNGCGKAGKAMEIDFHGHRDRNLDIPVALAAVSAGATRLHGVVLGIGERAGNTTLDAVLYNVARLQEELGGTSPYDLSLLPRLCRQYATMTHTRISAHHPLIGDQAFQTAVGIHADAQEKGMKKLTELERLHKGSNDSSLERIRKSLRTIYTSVDHTELGRLQKYVIGPLSGESTIRMWLYAQGYADGADEYEELVAHIKTYAKKQNHILRDEELIEMIEKYGLTRKRRVQSSQ